MEDLTAKIGSLPDQQAAGQAADDWKRVFTREALALFQHFCTAMLFGILAGWGLKVGRDVL
jgi:hypothetical protein